MGYHNVTLPISLGSFPNIRLRRTRQWPWSRNIVRENTLHCHDLILPLFIIEGHGKRVPIDSMPGVYRVTIDEAIKDVEKATDNDIPLIALFPHIDPQLKTEDAKEAYNSENLICRAIKKIKKAVPSIGIMTDIALDPYTPHGHDGLLKDNIIQNDETIDILSKQSLCVVEAGCDIIGPSDMMDGRIKGIRSTLDTHQHKDVIIMAYAAKYASSFYGPFRDAVGTTNTLNKADKKTYQMDPANSDEAIREIALDIQEGADMVIVKPGLSYLDIICRAKNTFKTPIFAYQVSGEYSMLKIASQHQILDWEKAIYETLLSFKRAGATGILTYAANDVAKNIKNGLYI